MGYCNKIDIEKVIAQAATVGSPEELGSLVDLIKIGNVIDSNLIPDDTVNQYIQWADNEIDSNISQMYNTPLVETANFEVEMFANIDDYNSYIVTERVAPLNIGDVVFLKQYGYHERFIIKDSLDSVNKNIFLTEEPILYPFKAIKTKIIRVAYPNPITVTSAMLAASRIYDRYFSGQVDPNESQFGKNLREQARRNINNILNGRTILHGIHRIGGSGYYNPASVRGYTVHTGSAGAKDIDGLGR